MKLGFSLPVAGAWSTPENLLRIAQQAEALGYESLWTLQRLLYALEPKNDYPPMPGQPWPKHMQRVLDPIVTLASLAGTTKRIRLGVSVLNMPYYTPITLAKQLATLDLLSGGRLDVGLGLGWSMDEYDAVNVPFRQRGRRGDEFVRALKACWTEPVVEFEGEFYRVPKSLVEPKPVQKPHPPILIGGYGSAAVRRAVALGDGFSAGNVPIDQTVKLVRELCEQAEAAGRDPASLRVVCRGTFSVYETPQGPDRRPLWGSLDEIRDDLKRYAEAGLTEIFLEANFSPSTVAGREPAEALERAIGVMEALAPGR